MFGITESKTKAEQREQSTWGISGEIRAEFVSHHLAQIGAVLVTHTETALHGFHIPDSERHLSIHITCEIYVSLQHVVYT